MLKEVYSNLVASGELRDDPGQYAAIAKLDNVLEQLRRDSQHSWFSRKRTGTIKGAYLWGQPGRGKTMLMDMFFRNSSVPSKWRVHFHEFMIEVHRKLYHVRRDRGGDEALAQTAQRIAKKAKLLCLDEMQIADIADAMIVGRLFDKILQQRVIVVTTSNVAPVDLYKDGLNRQLFLPFVHLIENNLDVIGLDGPTDYRLGRVKGHDCYIAPPTEDAKRRFQHIWEQLTDTAAGSPVTLELLGRRLPIPEAARWCARFTFADLCESPLGAPDFLAIAQNFKVVFVEGIPILEPDKPNEAKRFILLVDALYDKGVKLVATAQAPPEALYPSGKHLAEFRRTVSRLQEMRSASWWGGRIAET